nr:MAG TPA: hypothetical protein [Caudoviricetes sp.]
MSDFTSLIKYLFVSEVPLYVGFNPIVPLNRIAELIT